MPRFARMLSGGMIRRGHQVQIWSPRARCLTLPSPAKLKKWLGYGDQYVLFPWEVRRRLTGCAPDTLFVFTDHALGPWVPMLADRPHVIHCHDFLAQRSALGEIKENPTFWTGRQYQGYIRQGYSKGKNFVSVSHKTREDLHDFLGRTPALSEVLYNGLNQDYAPADPVIARSSLGKTLGLDLEKGFLFHIGGNQWYKNRGGVLDIYDAFRAGGGVALPLLMVGTAPVESLQNRHLASAWKDSIHFIPGLGDDEVRAVYTGASALLFPSLAEGFGWPIAEAMASGCLVLTTGEAPMTEVAGDAGVLIPRRPSGPAQVLEWAKAAGERLTEMLGLGEQERREAVNRGRENVKRFQQNDFLDRVESLYVRIVSESKLR